MTEGEAQGFVPPGFFGKLPSRGDFVTRRLPPDLLAGWTDWLDASLDESRRMLGEAWQAAYLSSALWRFSASPGCCSNQAFAGVLMPSVDRVGRYYPLSIVAPLGAEWSAAEIAVAAGQWFEQVEALALSCLTDVDLDAFDAALAAAPIPRAAGAALPTSPAMAVPGLLGHLLEQNAIPYSLWWTTGPSAADARVLAFPGLPPRAMFALLLSQANTPLD
jgi:type VI secretion system protein ImpM